MTVTCVCLQDNGEDDEETVREYICNHLSNFDGSSAQQQEELAHLGEWFQLRSEEAHAYRAKDDAEETAEADTSLVDINNMVSSMGSLRSKMATATAELLSRTCDVVRKDDTKRLLKEQEQRFAAEVSTLMGALHRVEGHAKGLTSSNLEMRDNIKALQAEKQSWQRRYMSLAAKEDSLVMQMELAIKQRTEALQLHLSRNGDSALAQLMDQARQQQTELSAAQENLRQREEQLDKAREEKRMVRTPSHSLLDCPMR